jgi:hypothetical protein
MLVKIDGSLEAEKGQRADLRLWQAYKGRDGTDLFSLLLDRP